MSWNPTSETVPLLGPLRLIVGDRADHFGGEAVAAGDFPGDLRLVHRLRGIQPPEEDEQISESQDDQDEKKQTAADDDAGVELRGSDIHEKWG